MRANPNRGKYWSAVVVEEEDGRRMEDLRASCNAAFGERPAEAVMHSIGSDRHRPQQHATAVDLERGAADDLAVSSRATSVVARMVAADRPAAAGAAARIRSTAAKSSGRALLNRQDHAQRPRRTGPGRRRSAAGRAGPVVSG